MSSEMSDSKVQAFNDSVEYIQRAVLEHINKNDIFYLGDETGRDVEERLANILHQRIESGEYNPENDGEEMSGPRNNYRGVGPKARIFIEMRESSYIRFVHEVLLHLLEINQKAEPDKSKEDHINGLMRFLFCIHLTFAGVGFQRYCPDETNEEKAWYSQMTNRFINSDLDRNTEMYKAYLREH